MCVRGAVLYKMYNTGPLITNSQSVNWAFFGRPRIPGGGVLSQNSFYFYSLFILFGIIYNTIKMTLKSIVLMSSILITIKINESAKRVHSQQLKS